MKLQSKLLAVLAAAALAGGCAHGRGSGGGGPGLDTPEEQAFCVIFIILCWPALVAETDSSNTGTSQASASGSSNPASFTSWAALRRDAMTGTSGNIIESGRYELTNDGSIKVLSQETSTASYGEVQYDAAGRPVHFAAGAHRSRDGGRTLSNLSTAGQPWLDVGYSAGIAGSAQTPFVSRPAGEVELAANPYVLGWNYQSFGVWDSAVAGLPRFFGGTSFGSATPAAAVPTSGAATFTGKLAGLYVSPGGQGSMAAADLKVEANFSSRSLSFASSNTVTTRDLQGAAPAANLNLRGTLTYSPASNTFTGALTSAGGTMSGSTTGRYYGPAAQELGGAFNLKGSGAETFAGAYGAKR